MKRILTIQDISCLGKCSLTVALPLLSAMGYETVILPTAVLSTHTMFKNFTCKDLSAELQKITAHWKKENIRFDAIYTGYLGTEEEIETVISIISEFRTDKTQVFVDPAMGDNGKLYPAFDLAYARHNARLCAIADCILPNITEAAFMTGLPYKEEYDETYIRELLAALHKNGTPCPILTGVSLSKGKTGAYGYDGLSGNYFIYQNNLVDAMYHGTGDIFSSVAIGALLYDLPKETAMKIAADYTAHTIEITKNRKDGCWYGVDFESTIGYLLELIASNKKN
ncbi:MAG: pyridoxamine kinase [Succinivibrio sp.]|nr:pyridoxamine kinase [Succinivibrio sp.]